MVRSLYDCMNAIFPNNISHIHVWCRKGHALGRIRGASVMKANPLISKACKNCRDFDEADPTPLDEKGW